MRIKCEKISVYLDEKGNIQKITFQNKIFEPPLKYTFFEINGELADVEEVARGEGELSLRLNTRKTSGGLTISSGREVKMHFEPDEKDSVENVSIVVSFPLETEFHIPERYNLGRKIDREMPVGESYSTSQYEKWQIRGLGYNFFLANFQDVWLRFRTNKPKMSSANVDLTRHPELFIAAFTWKPAGDCYIGVFSSMSEAIEDFENWLETELGVKKMSKRPNLPGWVHNVKLVLFIDMMRSNWEIAHDYEDVANLARDLKRIGCPKDTILQIPGWNGAFDSTYPTYRPHPELGGEEKFKEMIDTIHENGFRVVIHTNSWGLDPYHPEIDKLEKYAIRDDKGCYQGWQIGRPIQAWGGRVFPPSKSLGFRTDKVQISGVEGAKSFTFETPYVPDTCEALFTVGGLKVGDARVRFTIGRRSITTPPGWFKTHDEYEMPFPFLLKEGRNKVHVEVIGEAEPDWSESWYNIRHCLIPLSPYTTWTHPILIADINNPEWIRIYVDEVTSVVGKYNIDAVYVDATSYFRAKKILHALRERLPDIPLGCETLNSLEDLGFWTYSLNARVSMLTIDNMTNWTTQRGMFPDLIKLEKVFSWMNKRSPICEFLREYVYVVGGAPMEAFVPVGKIINIFPPRLTPRPKEELWRIIRNARKLKYIPCLRLNYRRYGIDEEAKKAIQEIASN